MKKALFIDRDGTLIKEPPVDYQVDSLEKLEFMPGVFRNLYKLRFFTDFELVVVSNQDGMGTSSFPEAEFRAPHEKFLEAFRNEGVEFEAVHIDPSLPEENSPNRKPGTGMLIYNAKAKVLPVYIHNSRNAWPKGSPFPKLFLKIHVVYGELISFDDCFEKEPSKELYVEITNRVMDRIKALRDDFTRRLEGKKSPPSSRLRGTG